MASSATVHHEIMMHVRDILDEMLTELFKKYEDLQVKQFNFCDNMPMFLETNRLDLNYKYPSGKDVSITIHQFYGRKTYSIHGYNEHLAKKTIAKIESYFKLLGYTPDPPLWRSQYE